MADGDQAQPLAGGPADKSANELEHVELPLSGASNYEWTSKCAEEVRKKGEAKMYRMMNGIRVTTWRICVEKRRCYLGSLLGVQGSIAGFPDDLRKKVLEFLPNTDEDAAASGDRGATLADVKKAAERRTEFVAQKWAAKITAGMVKWAGEDGGAGRHLGKSFISDEQELRVCKWGKEWWNLPELHAKLREAGFTVSVPTGADFSDRCVLNVFDS